MYGSGTRPAAGIAVLYDHRHPAARGFRLRAAQWHVPIHGMHGDITDLWQNYFRTAWKNEPAPLAGLTERPALFLLEQLGYQHGMRVVFQAEHDSVGEGRWTHRVVRSSTPGLERQLDIAGPAWPAVLADQLLTAPQEVASKDSRPSGASMAAYLDEATKLHSWIIAPRSVVAHLS
jgi:hypothetical protein